MSRCSRARPLGLPPEPLTLEADVDLRSFGACTLQVAVSGGVQRETLRLTRTRMQAIEGLSDPGDVDD